MSPESEGQKTRRLREATQTAADVTATAYAVDGSIDVEQRLRDEFAAVGIELSDESRTGSGHEDGPTCVTRPRWRSCMRPSEPTDDRWPRSPSTPEWDRDGAFVVDTELKYTDVTLTSLMPGPTDTEFFDRADMLDTKVGQAKKDDPAQVARQGFDSLMAGESRVVGGGLKTKVQEAAGKVMPDKAKAAMHRGMAEPGTGE